MMPSSIIKELKSEEEILSAFPVMRELRTHLDKETYLKLVLEAQSRDMYQIFALYVADEITAVVGFKPMITLYYGRFVWVCDLVTKETERSSGLGAQLLAYVENWAKEHDYENVALSSGVQREKAHHFYEDKMEYEKVSYVFKKNINI